MLSGPWANRNILYYICGKQNSSKYILDCKNLTWWNRSAWLIDPQFLCWIGEKKFRPRTRLRQRRILTAEKMGLTKNIWIKRNITIVEFEFEFEFPIFNTVFLICIILKIKWPKFFAFYSIHQSLERNIISIDKS